jgi:hypothetical protein
MTESKDRRRRRLFLTARKRWRHRARKWWRGDTSHTERPALHQGVTVALAGLNQAHRRGYDPAALPGDLR